MDRDELRYYLEAQVTEIQKYKWIESERHCYDIGFDRAAMEWISLYGDTFQHYWMAERHTRYH